jgi:hypothetical protein
MNRARVAGWGVQAVLVDPEHLLEVARRNVELVVPARRAGVEVPDYWADAEERWATASAAYQAGDIGVHFTLFALLEEGESTERFEFGGVGSVWVRTEDQVHTAARESADAYRPMFLDDIVEGDTIEDISEEDFAALPLAISLDDALRRALGSQLSPREPPAQPNFS